MDKIAFEAYIRFLKEGIVPDVYYNVQTDDLLVFPIGDVPDHSQSKPSPYSKISNLVWAYACFGDILTALRAATLLVRTAQNVASYPMDRERTAQHLAAIARANKIMTSYDAGGSFLLSRYNVRNAQEEYEDLCGDSSLNLDFWYLNQLTMQNELESVRRFIEICQNGLIPKVWIDDTFSLLHLQVFGNSPENYGSLAGYIEISEPVWEFAQFGDLLTAFRIARLAYFSATGVLHTRLNVRDMRPMLSDIAAYHPFLMHAEAIPSDRFSEEAKRMECSLMEQRHIRLK